MKNNLYILLLAMSVLSLKSCDEAEPIIYDGPLFISFIKGTSGNYLVDDSKNTYNIQVGIPMVQQQDITAGLEVLYSTAIHGTHFYCPSSVTIPAGELTAEFSVQGFYEELAGRKDTLIIGFSGEVMSTFDSTYTLYMKQLVCNYEINELAGKWTVNETSLRDGPYQPYELTTIANPNGGDTIVVTDYWSYLENYDATFKIAFDISDTNNITCHIPYQYQFQYESLGNVYVESFQDGTFSKCYQVISELGLRISVKDEGIIDETLLTMELQW